MEKLVPLTIVFAFILGTSGLFMLVIRWARKSSRRGAFASWGVQLFGAGMDPVPPPQEQIEEIASQSECLASDVPARSSFRNAPYAAKAIEAGSS